MNLKVENLEHNMAKLTVTVDAKNFDEALDKAFNRQKKSISVPGFRKGKVPRAFVERMYGPNVFYEDATDILLKEVYPKAYEESGLDIVSQPKIDIVQVEKGKEFIFTAEVAVKPEVKLGKYKGVTVTKADTKVLKKDIENEIKHQLEHNKRLVEVKRASKDGDTVDINFEGFIGDAAFEGGKGDNYKLLLGSHSFIDNFEDQLIGKKKGEDVDVNVTFPANYQEKSLASKEALFKVHINSVLVNELPKLDDEFVQDISEFDTVDEYKADVEKNLIERKEKEAKSRQEDEAIESIILSSTMDIPQAMIDSQVDRIIGEMESNMKRQGITMKQYLEYTGTNLDLMKKQVEPDAIRRIQSTLVLEAIAKEEKIEVSDSEVDSNIEKIAKHYGMNADDLKKNLTDEEKNSIIDDIKVEKAVDFIMDNVKEKAQSKAKKTKADAGDKEDKKSTEKKAPAKKAAAKKTTKKAEEEKKDK